MRSSSCLGIGVGADETDDWAACNLREPFLDILRRAGVSPWPKLFQAMRASCENDLVDAGYPLSAITAWMGHTTKVAEKHYLRVRKEHFEKAAENGAKMKENERLNCDNLNNPNESPSEKTVQNPVQQASEWTCTDMHRIFEMPEFAGSFALMQVLADKGLAEAGLEPA